MSVGVWKPSGQVQVKSIDVELLKRFINVANELGEDINADSLQAQDMASTSWVMNLDRDAWSVSAELSSEQLKVLIRWFTLVEENVQGWEAGNKSPVIALVSQLKARGEFEGELRKWIKSTTTNRYLPYGSAL